MDKLTDFDSLPAEQLTDEAILYAVQSGEDYQLSIGTLKTAITPAATANHEDLHGLQGGESGDHQHLTTAQVNRIPSTDVTDALTGTSTPSASNKFVTQDSLPDSITGVGKRLVRTADSGTGLVEATQLKVSPSILQIVGETTGENDVVEGYTGNVNGLSNAVYHSDTNTGAQFSGFRAAGTKASPGPIALGQRILSLFGAGYNSLAFKAAAAIRFIASENWTPTANGTKIVFYTQKNGTVADGALTPKAIISDDGQLAVGGSLNPDPSALFELQSTNQGSLFAPKMTQAQRDAIQSPAQALTIYNTNTDQYEIYNGTTWNPVGSGAGEGGTVPLAVAPSGAGAIETQTLTFTAAPAQQFFGLRFTGHTQLFEFQPTATNATLKAGIDTLLAAIPGLESITSTVTGSLTGTVTKSGTRQIIYSAQADIPPLQVISGAVRHFVVSSGDTEADYRADGGAPFSLGITQAAFQANQRAIDAAHNSVVTIGSSTVVTPTDFTTGATWTGSADDTSACWNNNFTNGVTNSNVVDMRLDVGALKTIKRLKLYSTDQNADKLTIQTRVDDAYWQDGEGDDIPLLSSVDIIWEADPIHSGLYVATFDFPSNTTAGRFYRVYPYHGDLDYTPVTIREIEMFESTLTVASADFTSYFPVGAAPSAPSAAGTDATNTNLIIAGSPATSVTVSTTQQGSILTQGNDGTITALDKAHLNQFDEDGSLSVPGPLKINSDDAGEVDAIPGYPGNVNGIANVVYNGDTNTGAQFGGFRAAGPPDAPTAIEQNQRILSLFGAGHDGESFKATAAIRLLASQDWTPTANGSKIAFYTQQNDTIADGALSAKAVLSDQGQFILGGTLTPDPSALFELQSDTKGSLFAPKMTAAQRDAIPTPTDGLTIYNTDESSYQTYDGTTWTSLGSGGTGASITTVSTPDDLAGLKLWLRRATATPTTWDDAKNNHDATITSGAINAEGVQFDGSTTYASGSATALPSGNSPRTLFTSFRPAVLPDAGNSQVLFFYGAPSGNNAQGLALGNYGDGTYWVSYFDYITDIEVVAPLYVGQTYTLAGTYDGTTAKIYFNGTLAKTVSRPDWNTTPGGNYRLGGLPTSDPTFNGTIAETLIYNRDLTASEVAALHALTTTAGAGSGAGGNKTLTIAANGLTSPLNLTTSQAANTALIFTGNRTAPLDLIPPTPTALTIKNSTTGGHPLQFRPSLSSPKISIGPAETWQLFTDGTDVWGKKLDLAALSPNDISGQFLWLKADSLGLLDGAQIATWNDSSGNNNHATQEESYYQPTYVANVLNGKPAVRFNGSGQHLAIPHNSSLNLISDFTMFIVYKANNSCAIIAKRDNDPDINWELLTGSAGNNDALRFAAFNGGVGDQWNSSVGEYEYQSFSLTHEDAANQLRFYRNGVADVDNPLSMGETLISTDSPVYIGCQFTSTGVNSPMQGDILEFIGYNRLLSSSERQGIESYLANKYGV